MNSLETLGTELADGDVRLVPMADAHIEPLRAACAEDSEIWDIYAFSMLGEHFDRMIMIMRTHFTDWVKFAALQGEKVVGMTNLMHIDPRNGVLEIGCTYIAPHMRGTGYNRRMKKLLIEHAFAEGFRRIEFRVDDRNLRSQAAVKKLGAVHEGTTRADLITWTGHLRNTCIFGLLREEWRG